MERDHTGGWKSIDGVPRMHQVAQAQDAECAYNSYNYDDRPGRPAHADYGSDDGSESGSSGGSSQVSHSSLQETQYQPQYPQQDKGPWRGYQPCFGDFGDFGDEGVGQPEGFGQPEPPRKERKPGRFFFFFRHKTPHGFPKRPVGFSFSIWFFGAAAESGAPRTRRRGYRAVADARARRTTGRGRAMPRASPSPTIPTIPTMRVRQQQRHKPPPISIAPAGPSGPSGGPRSHRPHRPACTKHKTTIPCSPFSTYTCDASFGRIYRTMHPLTSPDFNSSDH